MSIHGGAYTTSDYGNSSVWLISTTVFMPYPTIVRTIKTRGVALMTRRREYDDHLHPGWRLRARETLDYRPDRQGD